MDDKHPVYEVTVVGLLAIVFFLLTSLVINDKFAFWILDCLREGLVSHEKGVSEAAARWIAFGVSASFCGSVIQIVAAMFYRRKPWGGMGREVLAGTIRNWVNRSCIDSNLKKAIKASSDDSLFVWVHYSDPRERLITWGRWKLRYAYLAENWTAAMWTGVSIGIVVGLVFQFWGPLGGKTQLIPWTTAEGLPSSLRWLLGMLSLVLCIITHWRLGAFRQRNIDDDLGMLAAYAAGVLCPEFRKKFLPSRREDDYPEKQ